MGYPDTPTAILALRSLIFDGPTDKIASNKDLVGIKDGVNLTFKTFEYRRTLSFTLNNPFPVGIYQNGTLVSYTNIVQDDTASGTFMLSTGAPQPRDIWVATYYYQWFLDSELDSFLQNASNWLGLGSTYINIPDGLNPALMDYAARESYRMAAMKTSVRLSQTYKMEDAPTEDIRNTISVWTGMAKDFLDSAQEQRKSYYSRQDQFEAPLFALGVGRVWDPTPRR